MIQRRNETTISIRIQMFPSGTFPPRANQGARNKQRQISWKRRWKTCALRWAANHYISRQRRLHLQVLKVIKLKKKSIDEKPKTNSNNFCSFPHHSPLILCLLINSSISPKFEIKQILDRTKRVQCRVKWTIMRRTGLKVGVVFLRLTASNLVSKFSIIFT